MELEFQLSETPSNDHYDFQIANQKRVGNNSSFVVDWEITIQQLLNDKEDQVPVKKISQKFHNTLGEIVVAIAMKVEETKVILSGGCFQNRYLTEYAVKRLKEEHFHPYWHQRIPPNDGGIAVGQIGAAISKSKFKHS